MDKDKTHIKGNESKQEEKDYRREIEILNKKLDEYGKLIKFINGKENTKRTQNNSPTNSQSRMSMNQKSRFEEKTNQNAKVTFQQFISFDEKVRNCISSGGGIILSDKDYNNNTLEDRINSVMELLETYKDSIVDNCNCKHLKDIIMLEIYLTLSPKAFQLYSNDKEVDHIRKYMNNMKKTMTYDLEINPNETLFNLNQNMLNITDVSDNPQREVNIMDISDNNNNSNNYDYDDDSESSNSINEGILDESISSEKEDDSKNNESDSDSEIVDAEEINEDNQHKLIFFDENSKMSKIIPKLATTFSVYPHKYFLIKKEHLIKLRKTIYEDIMKLIETESYLLPKYKHNISIEKIMKYVNKVKEKKKQKVDEETIKLLINRRSIFLLDLYDTDEENQGEDDYLSESSSGFLLGERKTRSKSVIISKRKKHSLKLDSSFGEKNTTGYQGIKDIKLVKAKRKSGLNDKALKRIQLKHSLELLQNIDLNTNNIN